ncbi:MAG: hypothetical protein MUO43_10080, partial [Desulfobacterales bacterium]|nr:hypothetical protein [Desulfobacterales bacterium]
MVSIREPFYEAVILKTTNNCDICIHRLCVITFKILEVHNNNCYNGKLLWLEEKQGIFVWKKL